MAAQQKRVAPEHDDQSRSMRLRRFVQDFVRYGNDNLQPGSAEELAQSKRRTWEMFARWLMFGGLLFALILIAVLAFVYSRYP
ncbi:MAG TPA: hypothetical protein VJV39_08725 [Dongiaceae bacterium]|nr:hypothetical protein [Dongiaceae bacterium]